MSKKIAVIVGSIRKESFNRKLATGLIKLASDSMKFEILEISQLSMYNQDLDNSPPSDWVEFRKKIKGYDAVVFVTPEYNRSIPGVLKNAIDIGSRPYGQSVWAGKPAGVMGVSVGAIGTALAQQHLRNMLAYLDMPTLGQPEIFVHYNDGLIDANGNIGSASKEFFQGWMNQYTAWVEKNSL